MIRTFRPEDLDRLMQLWLAGNLEAHAFVPREYWLSHAAEVRELLPQADLYLYEEDGRIQGFAGVTDGYLAGIFVDRDCRSRGIGRRLLAHVKEHCPSFTLHVYRENRRATAFYLREGLSVVSEELSPETGQYELLLSWDAENE